MLEFKGSKLVKSTLTCMSERSVAKVMAESNCFGQILIQTKSPSNSSCDLAYLKRVGKTGSVMSRFGRKKNLCFML